MVNSRPSGKRRRTSEQEDTSGTSDEVTIPEITEDASERKRLLNVLAQRRYRKRRREKLEALQARFQEAKNEAHKFSRPEDNTSSPDTLPPSVGENPIEPRFLYESTSESSDGVFPNTLDPLSNSFNTYDLLSFPPPTCQDPQTLLDFFSPPLTVRGSDETYDLTAKLQDHQVSTFTFPDDHLLEVPSLTLLNGVVKVALRLKIADRLWDRSGTSPFCVVQGPATADLLPIDFSGAQKWTRSSFSLDYDRVTALSDDEIDIFSSIPAHLHPTRTQRVVPHHPVFDILPWPNTRDKLIQVFNLPPHLRPPAARDELALMRLVYDMEDPGGEGLNITGQDPLEPQGWEIGQHLFERWWWAFESKIVEESSERRRARGLPCLMFHAAGSWI